MLVNKGTSIEVRNKQVFIIGARRYQFYRFQDDNPNVPRSLRSLVTFMISSLKR